MAKGEGSVTYRKSDGRYQAAVTINGKRVFAYGKTKAEAQRKRKELLRARDFGLNPDSQTVSQYLRWWVDYMAPRVRASTLDSYVRRLRRCLPYIGTIKFSRLTPEHVANCLTSLRREGQSDSEVQAIYSRLHQALSAAVKFRKILYDPSSVVRPISPERREKRSMTVGQVQHLLGANRDDRWCALWALLISTGLRIGEARSLCWKDIDFESQTVRIRRQLVYAKGRGWSFEDVKTRSSRRTIALSSELLPYLEQHRVTQKTERVAAREWQDQDLVFCGKNGAPLSNSVCEKRFAAALGRAGLEHFTLHEMRHTYTSLQNQFGAPQIAVQKALGHRSAVVTNDIYTHVVPGMQEEAAERMNTVLRIG